MSALVVILALLSVASAAVAGWLYRNVEHWRTAAQATDNYWTQERETEAKSIELYRNEKDAAVMHSSELDTQIQDLATTIKGLIAKRDELLAARERQWFPEGVPELVELAKPFVEYHDPMPQSGEWKFHQIYAALLKQKPDVEKWKLGLAIHLAVADRRIEESSHV